MEPSPSITPLHDDLQWSHKEEFAEPMPPLPLPFFVAKSWTDPPPGIHHGLSFVKVLKEITASSWYLQKMDSIYTNIQFVHCGGVSVICKPPNHSTEEEQQLSTWTCQVPACVGYLACLADEAAPMDVDSKAMIIRSSWQSHCHLSKELFCSS